jgi:hypothetical protein
MPDRGLLEPSQVVAGAAGPHSEGATWLLTGVRLAQITFEVNRESALAVMPGDVGRPVPCYARLIVIEAGASPAGPLRIAALCVGGRYRMMPRNVLVDAVVDGDLAVVSAALGGPYCGGSVGLVRDGSRLEASVAAEEGDLARVTFPALSAVDPAMLRWDPWLGFSDADGALQLVEYSMRPRATEAFLSKDGTLQTPPALPPGHRWRQLRNLNTVSSCYIEGELEILLPQPQQSIL